MLTGFELYTNSTLFLIRAYCSETELMCVCAVCELMSRGVFAIFVTHTVSSLGTVRSYSSTFQMPIIMSRVAINTTRSTLQSSGHATSLHAALTAVHTPHAAVPSKPTFSLLILFTMIQFNTTIIIIIIYCNENNSVRPSFHRIEAKRSG